MITESEKRLEAFEKMLKSIIKDYDATDMKMKQLKSQGKEKTATYRQLMGNKLQYRNIISIYESYGLTDQHRVFQ